MSQSMIVIHINGERQEINSDTSLIDLLKDQDIVAGNTPFAVAINQVIVPRVAYASTLLRAHDRIEIVMPMAGG